MTEIEIKMPESRGKTVGLAIGAVVVVLFLVDFLVLRGEQVDYDSTALRDKAPMVLSIARVGEDHLVEIDTHHRVSGKTRGQTVKIRFEDPSGTLIYEKSELTAHKDRYFRFKPDVAGEYKLYVEPRGELFGPGSGRARASVFVNDRRIFGRLLAFMPI